MHPYCTSTFPPLEISYSHSHIGLHLITQMVPDYKGSGLSQVPLAVATAAGILPNAANTDAKQQPQQQQQQISDK